MIVILLRMANSQSWSNAGNVSSRETAVTCASPVLQLTQAEKLRKANRR